MVILFLSKEQLHASFLNCTLMLHKNHPAPLFRYDNFTQQQLLRFTIFAFWIEKGSRYDPFSLHQTRVTVYAFLCVPVVQGNFRMPPVWEKLCGMDKGVSCILARVDMCLRFRKEHNNHVHFDSFSKESHYILTMGSQVISLWSFPTYFDFLQRLSSPIHGHVSKNNHIVIPIIITFCLLILVPPWILLWSSAALA